MNSLTRLTEVVDVVIGVDTHVHTHSAAMVAAGTGGVIEDLTIAATGQGYAELVEWADDLAGEHGTLRAWAIEGTGSHGAGLARYLRERGEVVIELDRPERAKRRNGAKSDPLDAVRAAREALSRTRVGTPRQGVERQALSVLLAARRSAVEATGVAQRQLFSLVIAAPEAVRARFAGQKKLKSMVATGIALRVQATWDLETTTTVTVLRNLARRARTLQAEADAYEKQIKAIIKDWRPDLLDQIGVGPIVAAVVLCAWSHPGRIHSEAGFAMLAGVAPIEATSGQVVNRHRLNRYGDRQLNRALHTIAITRQRRHQPTRDYTEKRTSQGKNPREIRRCLKRYIARDLYRLLEHRPLDPT
ncbi:IS110 family transposase [Nocardioides limicola]|uniref:IS110 family transposase n=1 Tax=Nocardioides limicola TaxID=2803368 RepID=UPI00193B5609|nr:IS110 family transposase [Nocardioides sp. DJM-14]